MYIKYNDKSKTHRVDTLIEYHSSINLIYRDYIEKLSFFFKEQLEQLINFIEPTEFLYAASVQVHVSSSRITCVTFLNITNARHEFK